MAVEKRIEFLINKLEDGRTLYYDWCAYDDELFALAEAGHKSAENYYIGKFLGDS